MKFHSDLTRIVPHRKGKRRGSYMECRSTTNLLKYTTMKTPKFPITTILLFTMLVTTLSCKDDICSDTVCLNGGTCNEGTCECAEGYSGSDCATLWKTKAIGDYTVTSISCSPTYTGSATVSSDPSDDLNLLLDIAISNADSEEDALYQFKLTMTGETTFTVPTQNPCLNLENCSDFSGSGQIDADGNITMSTPVNDYDCVWTLNK